MPEGAHPRTTRSHTSTAQWQSFEVRMRRRRVERCVLRAEVALEAGYPDDARLAMAEARQLDPHVPLDDLEARIAAARTTAPVAPTRPSGRRAGIRLAALAAALALAILSALMSIPTRPGAPVEPAVEEAAAEPPTEGAPPPTVGIREQLVTPDIVTTEPQPAPTPPPSVRQEAAARPRPTDPATAAPPGAPQPDAGRTAAEATEPRPSPPVPDAETPAVAALPPPIEPVALATTGTSAPPLEPVVPAVDPIAEHTSRIRAVLSRYEAAYTGLDAAAARAVWPAVDERALARAFNNLESQRITLDQCDVSVNGASARAECRGIASWVPKVGGGGRTEARRWTFDLRQAGANWQIVRAEAR